MCGLDGNLSKFGVGKVSYAAFGPTRHVLQLCPIVFVTIVMQIKDLFNLFVVTREHVALLSKKTNVQFQYFVCRIYFQTLFMLVIKSACQMEEHCFFAFCLPVTTYPSRC